MSLTNAFRDLVCAKVVGTASNAFDTTTGYIGVGDSSTAFAASQTDLQASTNKLRKVCTTASATGNVWTFATTFATGDANFAWAEWGVFNGSSAQTMMNRKVESLGTKTSAQTWTLTATITLSVS